MKICRVMIEHGFLDQQFYHYRYEGYELELHTRVRIPFNGREIVGVVWSFEEIDASEINYEIKPILGVIDQTSLFDDDMNKLAEWLSYYYCTPLIMAYQTILPNKIKPSSSTKAPKLKKVYYYHRDTPHETPKAQAIVEALKNVGEIDATDFKVSPSILKRLVERQDILVKFEEVTYKNKFIQANQRDYLLNSDQQKVVDAIDFDHHQVSLIHGVTGSGKTEVYMSLCEKALSLHHQVLIMVPEIALTPQMIERFQIRFGMDVGVYHSALNDQEKYEQYQRVKEGQVQVVIGTRSAVFLPFSRLKLIVMDEEHDTSYKNGNMPFYHARDVAIHRAEMLGCPLVLGSASPSFESYARALKGVYQLLEMPRRIYDQMPEVQVVDMSIHQRNKRSRYLSDALCQAIDVRLEHHEQTILLLNRRGYNTLVKCELCDEVICCPHCDIALTFHKETNLYQCHTCGYQSAEVRCAKGHTGRLVGSGIGTQKLQEECQKLFPTARIERLDYDTTRTKNAHAKILKRFENKEIDLLIGTQMIAKGIDVTSVTQVGILSADATLMREDYRSSEMTFDLLLQASGRSGRGKKKGEVIIQTFNPNHYAVQCATHHDYKRFFAYEMKYRKLAQYPPYSYLIAITLVDQKETKVDQYASYLKEKLILSEGIRCLGPAKLIKRADYYRTRFILKGKDIHQMILEVHNFLQENSDFRVRIRCLIDINPMVLEA